MSGFSRVIQLKVLKNKAMRVPVRLFMIARQEPRSRDKQAQMLINALILHPQH